MDEEYWNNFFSSTGDYSDYGHTPEKKKKSNNEEKNMSEFDSQNIDWETVGAGASTFASGLGDLFYSQDRIDRQNEMLSAAEDDIYIESSVVPNKYSK